MNKTKIEWCDSTWNPVTGCFHDCEYCYARKVANRFGKWRPGFSDESCTKLHTLENKIKGNPYPYLFEPTLHKYRLKEPEQKTKPQTIFVCSMADLFGHWVPEEWIEEVFRACEVVPQHRYLFLTKNPARYIELSKKGKLPRRDNMWYGTTVTKPIVPFFWSKFHHTFLSIEPLLEDFSEDGAENKRSVDWLIVGAETGQRKDKVTPEASWIEFFSKFCDDTKTPLFMKDSLLSIIGEDNMRREFPWNNKEDNKK